MGTVCPIENCALFAGVVIETIGGRFADAVAVIVRGLDVAVLLRASVTLAVTVWAPAANTCWKEYGVVVFVERSKGPSKNSTLEIAFGPLAVALIVTVSVGRTVSGPVGLVNAT